MGWGMAAWALGSAALAKYQGDRQKEADNEAKAKDRAIEAEYARLQEFTGNAPGRVSNKEVDPWGMALAAAPLGMQQDQNINYASAMNDKLDAETRLAESKSSWYAQNTPAQQQPQAPRQRPQIDDYQVPPGEDYKYSKYS